MTRKSYPIDIKKPVFPFGQEYWPNKAEPVNSAGRQRLTDNISALDIRNVLPTPYGFSSFFGNVPLGNLKLPPCTQKVFTYKDSLGNNTLIALGVYGAMFSNDGVNWNTSEVPTVVVQTAVGSYEYQPDMGVSYTGFVQATATFTKASSLTGVSLSEVTPSTLGTDAQDIVVLPVTATNTYYQALHLTVPYDAADEFDRLVNYIDPGITGTLTVGDTYVMTTVQEWATHTVTASDTITGVIISLLGQFNSKSDAANRGVYAEYISDNKIKLWATSAHTTTELEYATIYRVPAVIPTGTLLGTMNNDQVPITIPRASIGNLGYIVFDNGGVPLTNGDYNIRRGGMYQVGGTYFPDSNVTQGNDGSLYYTDVNLLIGNQYPVPLTEDLLALRQFTGTTETGLTARVYDTGIALTSTQLGSDADSTKQTVNCNLTAADIVVGRVVILQSLGQLGSYTILAGDTIHSTVAGVVAAYNLAGTGVATQHGEQLITTIGSIGPVYFQPASLTTMIASTTNSEYYYTGSYRLENNFVASSELDKLYSLEFNTTNPSTDIIYRIYCNGDLVPVTSPTGAWSDANYEFTSAQILAAQAVGTKLMVRLTGKHLTVMPRNAGTGNEVLGGIGFRFRAITSGRPNMSTHSLGSILQLSANATIDHYQIYSYNKLTKSLIRYTDLPVSVGTVTPQFSPYQELGATSTGIVTTGLTQNTPSTDVFQMSIPVLADGTLQGRLVNLSDSYTPDLVTIVAVHPISSANVTLTTSAPMSIGGYVANSTLNLSTADQTTFGVFNPWTWAIVKNRLYCYRNGQGAGTYVLRLLQDGTAWEQLTPTFANMAQIEGIFEARGRLGMWDTTGSIYTSSVTDPIDFTPAIKTHANVTKVDAVRGNIVLVLGFKDGFIIYSTASIIQATYQGGTTIFKYRSLNKTQGILNTDAVTVVDDVTQFAYTQAGLYAVTQQGLQAISPEASTYIQSSKISPRLDFLENRYLSIAFAPEQPSWVVSKWESYSGSTIPGVVIPDNPYAPTATGVPATGQYTDIQIPVLNFPTISNQMQIGNGGGAFNFIPLDQNLSINSVSDLDTVISYIIDSAASTATALGYTKALITQGGLSLPTVTLLPVRIDISHSGALASLGFYFYALVEAYITAYMKIQALRNTGIALNIGEFASRYHSIVQATKFSVDTAAMTISYSDMVGLIVNFGFVSGTASSKAYLNTNSNIINDKYFSTPIRIDAQSPANLPTVPILEYLNSGNGGVIDIPLSVGWPIQGIVIYPNTNLTGILQNLLVSLAGGATTYQGLPTASGGSSVPSLVIPGGQYITTQGTVQNPDPIYTRALVLDTQLKNWGSCDTNFRALLDYIPINERAFNPTTGTITSNAFTYQNLAKAFAIMLQDGTLNLCTQATTDSYMEFGDIGFTNTGTTRFLDAVASFATETGTVLEVYGSRDGETLNPLFTSQSISANGAARLYKVLTGKWFRLRISGRFDIKALEFSGELGGNR